MADVTKTIGTDVSRDYSTLAAWHAALDNTTYPSAGTTAVGEVYDDGDIDESALVTVQTIGSNITALRVTAASGQEHTGKPGTGATFVNISVHWRPASKPLEVSWIEWSKSSASTPNSATVHRVFSNTCTYNFHHNIFHSVKQFSAPVTIFMSYGDATNDNVFHNNMVVDCEATFTGGSEFNVLLYQSEKFHVYNNTIHDCYQSSATDPSPLGIGFTDVADVILKNNIVSDITNSGSGTGQCYEQASPSTATVDYNIATDTSASGSNSHDSESSSSLFVSNSSPYDLRLVSGATNAIDGGIDLIDTDGLSHGSLELDIDGRDRDSNGDTWDIGADEYVAAGGGTWPHGPLGHPLHGPLAGPVGP